MNDKALVLLSGGMDSATSAFMAKLEFGHIATMFFKYGQRTLEKELECFNALSERLEAVESNVFELPFYQQVGKSSLTDMSMDIPEMDIDGIIPNTYVPFRNGVMLSIAAAWAEAHNYGHIYIGAVWEDSSGYPDCREDFLQAMEKAIDLGTTPESNIQIHYPVIHMTKDEIILEGIQIGVPFNLTWSCYQGSDTPCGKCPSCDLRAKAFAKAGLKDPLIRT